MLELVDRHDSGSCVRKIVGVQVSPRAGANELTEVFMRLRSLILALCAIALLAAAGCKRSTRPAGGTTGASDQSLFNATPTALPAPPDPNQAGSTK